MQLDHERLAELGLRRQPFPENAALDDRALRSRIDRIIELLKISSGTVLVTGPIGVGVSRLVLKLEAISDAGLRLLTIDGESHPTPDDICHACLEAFDLPPAPATSGPRLLDYVADWLDSLAQASDRPVMLVDNAHELSEQALDALLSMQEGEDEDYIGPGLLLAGAPELEERVARMGELLDEDHFHLFRLEPWSERQVAAYIAAGLEQAGGADGPAAALLDPAEIHLRSGGYPAQVRAACLQALNGPVKPEGGFIDRLPLPSVTPIAQIPAPLRNRQAVVILVAGVLFLTVLAFTLLRGESEQDRQEQDLVLQPRPVPAQPTDDGSQAEADQPEPRVQQPAEDRETPLLTTPDISPEPAPETDTPAPVPPEPEAEERPVAESTPTQPEADEPEPTDDAAPTTDAASAPAEASPPTTEGTAAMPDIANAMAREGADWLANRPSEHYTIQIVAAANPETLEAFVRDQPNRSALRLVPTKRNGEQWYVVVAGDYSNRETARSALDGLPSIQREHGPWVRTFGSLTD